MKFLVIIFFLLKSVCNKKIKIPTHILFIGYFSIKRDINKKDIQIPENKKRNKTLSEE